MTKILPLDQVLNLSLETVDSAGKPVSVPFDAPPTWVSDNTSVATVATAGDGKSAVLTPVSKGGATITVTFSVDGTPFSASEGVTVSGNTAEVIVGAKIVSTPASKTDKKPVEPEPAKSA